MGGGEASAANAGGVQHGREICAYGALAIGAGHVNGLPWLGIVPEQLGGASQAELYHGRRRPVNLSRIDVEVA